jgi:hypothetical protein
MRATLAVFVLALALWGCGHRADPLPPLRKTPPAPGGFRLAERGDVLEISADAPRASVDGVPFQSVAIEFLHAEGHADLEKAGEKRRVTSPPGRRVSLTLPLPAPGTLVRATARAVAGRETGPKALTLALVAQPPLEPPQDLAATLTEGGVALSWKGARPVAVPPPVVTPRTPLRPGAGGPARGGPATIPPPTRPATPPAAEQALPPSSEAGTKPQETGAPSPPALGGFLVYRRVGAAPYGPPLVQKLLEEDRYDDTAAPLGTTSCYVVRAVASMDPLIESASSNEACVDVRDITAPAAPAGLAVLPRAGGLELLWTPSTEPDLAGYRVYRAVSGGPAERLAEVPPTRSAWLDATAQAGETYLYSLSAVDQAGNESPRSETVEVTRP